VLTSLWACVAWYAAVSGRMLPRLLLGIVVVSELATADCSFSITDWKSQSIEFFKLWEYIKIHYFSTYANQ